MLHVTNGDCARVRIERAGISGTVLAWREVLHDGPVPAGLSAEELREVRARFLSERGWTDLDEARRELALADSYLASAADRDEVVLWFEHDLFDQLQLLQILHRADELGVVSRVRLAQADDFLGDLSDAELRALWKRRSPVAEEAVQLARRAWAAFRSPDPTAIEVVLAGDASAIPFLAPALRRLLEELPAVGDGLSRSERQLLEAIAAGAKSREAAFVAAQGEEEAPFMGDWSAFARLDELAAAKPPLLTLEPLGLTDAGRRVLAGKADRVELCGVDRWLGGVHLVGRRVPRWDRAAGRVSSRDAVCPG